MIEEKRENNYMKISVWQEGSAMWTVMWWQRKRQKKILISISATKTSLGDTKKEDNSSNWWRLASTPQWSPPRPNNRCAKDTSFVMWHLFVLQIWQNLGKNQEKCFPTNQNRISSEYIDCLSLFSPTIYHFALFFNSLLISFLKSFGWTQVSNRIYSAVTLSSGSSWSILEIKYYIPGCISRGKCN